MFRYFCLKTTFFHPLLVMKNVKFKYRNHFSVSRKCGYATAINALTSSLWCERWYTYRPTVICKWSRKALFIKPRKCCLFSHCIVVLRACLVHNYYSNRCALMPIQYRVFLMASIESDQCLKKLLGIMNVHWWFFCKQSVNYCSMFPKVFTNIG